MRRQRAGMRVSDYWGTLVNEDDDIEDSLSDDSLDRYEQLTKAQGIQVYEATKQFELARKRNAHAGAAPQLEHQDTPMHDAWASLEESDNNEVSKIKRDPNLQMVQISR